MKISFSIIIILLVAVCTDCYAQAKSVYFELGGPGFVSINYDMRFQKSEAGFGGRVGVGGFSITDEDGGISALFLPIGVTWLLGKDERNYFEIGGGVTPVFVNRASDSTRLRDFTTTFGHLHFGYRLQPKNGGFLFRAGLVPVFGKNGFLPYYFGLSFGYKF